ncbi:MAG TPA: EamA family transporter [Acidimicrobiales bacterium]|nr:EamA family transporter [Acidimicrobiales bacterium]
MSRRALALFALMSLVWGIPYLLIKVAVRHLTPVDVVEGRTLIGAALLMPLALRQGRIAPLLKVWKPLAVYCVCELAVPWFLLSNAERRIPSSLSGLLVATVPLISALLAYLTGHRHVLDRRGMVGLLIGLAGVAVLLGLDVHGAQLGSVAQVLVVSVGYALGPLITAIYLSEQSSLALAAVSLAVVAIGYLPLAVVQAPGRMPPGTVTASVVTLGVVCTGLAFVAFFELIKEVHPTKATLITYFNPMVAVVLGVAVLGEPFKLSTAVGFVLILGGSWFATGRSPGRETRRPAAAIRRPGSRSNEPGPG